MVVFVIGRRGNDNGCGRRRGGLLNLNDLIRYESEGSALDFKRIEYRKDAHADLLKDVLSMANAHVTGSRYIVTGVDSPPGGPKKVLGIDPGQMRDAATYQQLVAENIEPALDLTYLTHEFDGKTLGVFEISRCTDQPYQMRKDYTPLRRGEMWIRKGTTQMLVIREDLSRYEEQRRTAAGFSGEVVVSFRHPGTWPGPELQVHSKRFELPSEKADREIRKVLEARASARVAPTWMPLVRPSFSFIPYAERKTEELRELLPKIGQEWEDYDLAALFNTHAEAVNFKLVDKGDEYLEDARFPETTKCGCGKRIL